MRKALDRGFTNSESSMAPATVFTSARKGTFWLFCSPGELRKDRPLTLLPQKRFGAITKLGDEVRLRNGVNQIL